MKKRITAVLLTVLFCMTLCLPFSAHTLDVGDTNDYGSFDSDWGGDSDWGTGDWGDSDYYGDGTEISPGGLVIFVIIIVIFIILKRRAAKNGTGTSTKTGTVTQRYAPVTDNTAAIEAAIKENDPNFSSEKYLAWVKETFVTLQTAWTARDWSKIRPFEKEELFVQHSNQLNQYKELGRINIIERVDVRQAYLNRYVRNSDYEYLTVFVQARMGDYIIDEKTGEVVKGNKNAEYVLPYLIGYMRKTGIKTDTQLSGHSTTNCPNCGAPVSVSSFGKCEYCDSVITTGEFDWVMYKYQGVKPDTQVNNTAVEINDGSAK